MKVKNKLKIALVHDVYTYFGGAERVFLNFVKMFPQADIYTSIISDSAIKKLQSMSKGEIHILGISKFRFVQKYPDIFKPLILLYWLSLKLNKYDLVITSSHSFCSNWVKVRGKHVSYVYTPPRYLYGEFNEMAFIKKFPFKQLLALPLYIVRRINFHKIQQITKLVAISATVQKRIRKYYHRESTIIYPPVKLPKYKINKFVKKDYYVFFSRMVKQKGAYLAVNAFNLNGKKIVFIGEGKELDKLKEMANSNIKFIGFQDDSQLSKIFAKAKALIYCSIEEDFGMVPIEAMGHGVPVVAFKSGGVKETVVDGKTGVLFTKYSEAALNAAIARFEKSKISGQDSYVQASKFDKSVFKRKFLLTIEKILK